ncbi:MAG: type II toxin-antitoxin system HicB family antitoxin [Cytophagales bacterium]|nr:type II toxin-antitoxin system HicB family antitoxin [Cytophagales bacterium]
MDILHNYHINVFFSTEDNMFVAKAPDLKHCSALGNTPEKAISELRTAMNLWIETAKVKGITIPKPRYKPPVYQ